MSQTHPFLLARMRTAKDEAATPKYAHREIERRWLVDSTVAPGLGAVEPISISDRYLHGTRMRLRRMERGEQVVWKLTKKYEWPDDFARPIVTAYLSLEEHEIFAALPAATLDKQRFRLSEGGFDFSLDKFGGRLGGLWLAEIELDDKAKIEALPDPAWAARDITDDPRYYGATLALGGLPQE